MLLWQITKRRYIGPILIGRNIYGTDWVKRGEYHQRTKILCSLTGKSVSICGTRMKFKGFFKPILSVKNELQGLLFG